MREIRRFQRTMITILVGVNILVFSNSIYGDFSSALLQSLLGMGGVMVIISLYSQMKRNNLRKKSSPIFPSKES